MQMNRRDFFKGCCAVAAGQIVSNKNLAEAMASKNKKVMDMKPSYPMQRLGRTGLKVSKIGLGGIVVMNAEPQHACDVVARSVERGINYFDVAPTYGDAELKLGPALKPFRKDVFLACKTNKRDRAGASDELKKSLKQLQTDYFDVYQLHGIVDVEKDVKAAFARDGAMSAFLEARKNGVIRNLGFSAHTPEAALAAMREFDFDTIMYPVNFCTHFKSAFETEVLTEAKKRDMGIIGIKAIAKQHWPNKELKKSYPKCWYQPIDDRTLARLALSWTFEQNVSLVLPPCEEKLYELCMDLTLECGKLTTAERARLEELAGELNPIFSA